MKRFLAVLLCVILLFTLNLVGCSKQSEGTTDDDREIDKADTSGMDFGFNDDDVNPNITVGENVDIVFDDEPFTEDMSTGETDDLLTETEKTDTQSPETGKTETKKTETKKTETKKTETEKNGIKETETKATETRETETRAPETTAPETKEPVAQEPEPSPTPEITEIRAGGTYTLSGTKRDTTILIDAGDSNVQLILNGVTLRNDNGPAIYIRSAKKAVITLADGTVNTISDGSSYSVTDNNSTLDAAIFSKADLTVNGTGTLNLTGNYKHGIVSKDDLIISSGTIRITAKNIGLSGKDCVKINRGNITVNSGGDGIRSDNTEKAGRGYVYLFGGTISVTAGNDGIDAVTVVKIENVNLSVTAGGGSSTSPESSGASYKGLKAGSDIYITGGEFSFDTRDDCIHSNGTVTISGGTYTLSSGDDGVHADTDLEISGASTKLTVKKSYEGVEATDIVISGGNISVTASNDGIKAAGGNDSAASGDSFTASSGCIKISGGNISIKASGDGMDVSGALSVTGGNIMVTCKNSGNTSILDFDSTATISGGTFIGTGASAMAQNFSPSSTQGAIMLNLSGDAGAVIKLADSNGNVILTHSADNAFACVMVSHPSIEKGKTYTLTVGSSVTSITMSSTVYSG